MILAVAADKGSPGASTLATALALVWPGRRLLVETDPAGGTAGFRLHHRDTGELLQPDPSLAALAAAARLGLPPGGLPKFAQPTNLGFAVVPGFLTAERFAAMRLLWPLLAGELTRWVGTAICDVGRLQPGTAAFPVVKAADAVVLLGRLDLEGLFQLRERAIELTQVVTDPAKDGNPVTVVLTGEAKHRAAALDQAEQMFAASGYPIEVAGFFARDEAAAQSLSSPAPVSRRLAKSALVTSARSLAQQLIGRWPQLLTQEPSPVAASAPEHTHDQEAART